MAEITLQISPTEDAKDLPTPKYATEHAAGMDLYANISITIAPGEIAAVPLGFRVAVPPGYEAQIRARSGLSLKHGITMINGVGTIDADYRGEVCALVVNLGKAPYEISRADRIAQMVINRIERPALKISAALPPTERGEGGFGHTGDK